MKYKYPNNLCKLASAKLLSEANKHIKKMNPGIIGKLKQFLTGRNIRNENAIQAIKKYKEINKPMKLSKSLVQLEKKALSPEVMSRAGSKAFNISVQKVNSGFAKNNSLRGKIYNKITGKKLGQNDLNVSLKKSIQAKNIFDGMQRRGIQKLSNIK